MNKLYLCGFLVSHAVIFCLHFTYASTIQIAPASFQQRKLRAEKDEITDVSLTGLVRHSRQQLEVSGPGLASSYLDAIFKNHTAARTQLVNNFVKRNRIAVIYMCYNRHDIIRRSLPAVLRSEGVENLDVFISQDGGSDYVINQEMNFPESSKIVYIRHKANLCTGLHHHFVKAFTFEIMGYDGLIIVEEDNVVHPQALQLLARMIDLSVKQRDIGIVSLLDMDNSAFLDASKFAEGINRVNGTMGHLWVYGLHKSRYDAVRTDLYKYFNAIKGQDYSQKHHPPLSDKIKTLLASLGFPAAREMSQDRFFIYSLAKQGYNHRYQTLFRFFEPIGYLGLHYRHTEAQFFKRFGRGMYNGRIRPQDAFDISKDPANFAIIKSNVRDRINRVWLKYFPREAHEPLVNNTFTSLVEGRLNGVEAMANIRSAGLKYTVGKARVLA